MIVNIDGKDVEIFILAETELNNKKYYLYSFKENPDLEANELFVGLDENDSIVPVPEEDFRMVNFYFERLLNK